MGRDVTDRPPLAQRCDRPLLLGEVTQQRRERTPLLMGMPPHLIDVHGTLRNP
jgi:hypothetical protein